MEEEFVKLDDREGWNSLYFDIRMSSMNNKFSMKDAKCFCNRNFNRYRDVSPYDHTRVKLEDIDVDYINASYIDMPEVHRKYILTQGPLPHTAAHFWLMCWQQKSKAIVMLNRVIEKNTVKCHRYYPEHEGEELEFDEVGINVTYVSEELRKFYVLRHLKITHPQSNKSREVLHFHYLTWPDFGVPSCPHEFLHFLLALRNSDALDLSLHGPPIIHCSAGIGRSGTLCLVDTTLRLIDLHNGDLAKVSIQSILLRMREHRMGLIQTPDQLRFSYLAIITGIRSDEFASSLLSKSSLTSLPPPPSTSSLYSESYPVIEAVQEDNLRIVKSDKSRNNEDVSTHKTFSRNVDSNGETKDKNNVEIQSDDDDDENAVSHPKKLKMVVEEPLAPTSESIPFTCINGECGENAEIQLTSSTKGNHCSERELRHRVRTDRQRQLSALVSDMKSRQVAHERSREARSHYMSYLTHPITIITLSASTAATLAYIYYRVYH